MATSTFRNKNLVRPRKKAGAKRKRGKAQKQRLVALGMPAELVAKIDYRQGRDLLKRPAKVVKQYASTEE